MTRTPRSAAQGPSTAFELLRQLGVTSFTGTACLGAFELGGALGYGTQISNRVVDAIGDVAGGTCLQGYERNPEEEKR